MRVRDKQKEELIREKALKLIVRDGFDGFSMQKLAKEAGVSAATAYIYFENKNDLVHKLYTMVQNAFTEYCLFDFPAELPLEEGLRRQWRNRLRFVTEKPVYYRFMEQFRTSPLIDKTADPGHLRFRTVMSEFIKGAVERREISPMPLELFWAIAYGPFYTLVNFHLREENMMGTPFQLTESLLETLLQKTLYAIKYPNNEP